MSELADAVGIEVRLTPQEMAAELRREAREGLSQTPRSLSAKWHYDDLGSTLFARITRLEDYYPTRREREILEARAGEIARVSEADTLIELGSGFSEKTRLLLDALRQAGTLACFVPIDVSEEALRVAGGRIAAAYPGVVVRAIVADFERGLHDLPGGERRMIAFLGSTIGNLEPEGRAALLAEVAAALGPGGSFLVGADLVKHPQRLQRAYDDPGGVTAAFSKNVLAVMNRELGADFDLAGFRHDARWNPEREWMELGLVSLRAQTVYVRELGMTLRFARGEKLHTEISTKFRREGIERELAAAGLELTRWWTDPAGDFSLSLAVRR
jgi:L-histidine Nalpha-methyltransferase